MIYDDAFPSSGSDETEDTGIRYLMHEYFHTFQTSHFFRFEERNQMELIAKRNFQTQRNCHSYWYGWEKELLILLV